MVDNKTMKCYLAAITVEILVVAQDEEQARAIASDALDNEVALIDTQEYDISLAQYIPAPWDEHCLVYNAEEEDIKVADALKLNKT